MRIDQEQARGLFDRARVARLATTGGNAQPHVVPVTFARVDDRIVTAVDHKPKRTTALRRLRNIEENPKVSLLADHYEEDWQRLWWVRADGLAKVDEAAEHPELVDALVAKYPQYREQRPAASLIVIEVRRFSGWAANDAEESPGRTSGPL